MTNRGITINEVQVCSFGHVTFVDFIIHTSNGDKRYRFDWLSLYEHVNQEWVPLVSSGDDNSLGPELTYALRKASVKESVKLDADTFLAYADGWYAGRQAEVKVWVE